MQPYEKLFVAAELIGLKLTEVERFACIRVLGDATHVKRLRQTLADLEILEAYQGERLLPGELPTDAVFDAACAATEVAWKRHVLISILSWRWKGVAELRLAATLIEGEIARREEGAVA